MSCEPTKHLRWVVRLVDSSRYGPVRERVLQQWWVDTCFGNGIWRDVPTEDDKDKPPEGWE